MDVAVGNYDVCLGNFRVVPDRVEMAPFTVGLQINEFYLLVIPKVVDEATFAENLAKPFAPFTPGLWFLIIVFLAISGFMFLYTDSDNEDDFPYSELWERMLQGQYLGLAGYACGGPVHGASSAASKIVNLGFAFFIMIALATYTANLATILVMKNSGFAIESIADAIAAGHTICTNEVVNDAYANTLE